ncbi:TetR/AcrR family transcriptional regulator [Actinoplanes palleronii]|uniref:TetR family transcriptional regulator n=1 Tax=Actinoplanes palleronii TaxID=113570 RepID=A0ABQ4BTB0_9ACTN|nr:TetR/AcrR family transcriptional regulator [Actinoplanes palleronii]GIE73892.1 TetR family transcriptional regulator [Actinoplanes palleronii]
MVEGLRASKKRLTRQQLSDTAAALFLERGFDGVRITEVAERCGVSEKTVYNYFPSKEALVMDRLSGTATSLQEAFSVRGEHPLDTCLRLLATERDGVVSGLEAGGAPALAGFRRFGDLIRATPSLRAYQSEMIERLVVIAAEGLRAWAGRPDDDPPADVAAQTLISLWRVQFTSLRRHTASATDPARLRAQVTADVTAAAAVVRVTLDHLTAQSSST